MQLVNLSAIETRELQVLAGVFGEHSFTSASFQERRPLSAEDAEASQAHEAQFREVVQGQLEEKRVEINDRQFTLELAPGAGIRLDLGMKRFANTPSYSQPLVTIGREGGAPDHGGAHSVQKRGLAERFKGERLLSEKIAWPIRRHPTLLFGLHGTWSVRGFDAELPTDLFVRGTSTISLCRGIADL